jgi:glutaminyl-peptide cyclotransferase
MNQIFILIIMMLVFYSCSKEKQAKVEQPYSLELNNNVPSFNEDNAYRYILEQLDFGPRNPNSTGHQKALVFFESEMKKYTNDVYLQNFLYPGYNNEQLSLTNIIASFNRNAKNRIFICAHWDTRPRADQEKDAKLKNKPILGANDGASGVGIILELSRILKETPVDYGIDLILFDGEDYGVESDLANYFLGSKYFSANLPPDYKPQFGILLDMVGDKEAIFSKEGRSVQSAQDVVDMVWNIAQNLNASTFTPQEGSIIEDDHLPLNQAGIKTIDIIDQGLIGTNSSNERRNYWHTTKDDIENISKETLKQVGDVLTHLIYSLKFNKGNS